MSEMNVFSNPYSQVQIITCAGCSATWQIDNAGEGDIITPDPSNSIPLIMTGVNISYGRQATPIYPINTDPSTYRGTKYMIYGAPQGSISISSIFAPTCADLEDFLNAVCTTDTGDGAAECHGVTIYIKPFAGLKCKNFLNPDGTSSSTAGNGDISNAGMILYGVVADSLSMGLAGGAAAQVSFDLAMSFSSMRLNVNDSGN